MRIRVQNIGEVRDKIPLFRGLTNDQVQAIVDVGNLIELEPGRMLCHEGDESTAFFYFDFGDVESSGRGNFSGQGPSRGRNGGDGLYNRHASIGDAGGRGVCPLDRYR